MYSGPAAPILWRVRLGGAPAARSRQLGALPIGLAHGCALTRPVAAGACVTRGDVLLDDGLEIVRVRAEMEQRFGEMVRAGAAAE